MGNPVYGTNPHFKVVILVFFAADKLYVTNPKTIEYWENKCQQQEIIPLPEYAQKKPINPCKAKQIKKISPRPSNGDSKLCQETVIKEEETQKAQTQEPEPSVPVEFNAVRLNHERH